MAVPREAAHSRVPKTGTLAAPPAAAEAEDQPGVPNAGVLPVSGGGDQSSTVGNVGALLPVPAAAALGAEGGGPAAASATAGPPLLVPVVGVAKPPDHLKASLGVGAVVVPSGGAEAPAMGVAEGGPGVPNAGELPAGLPVGGAGMAASAAGGPSAVPWVRLKVNGDPPLENLVAAAAAGVSA